MQEVAPPLVHDRAALPLQLEFAMRQSDKAFGPAANTTMPMSLAANFDEMSGTKVVHPPEQSPKLARIFSINSGHFRIRWTVDAQKLQGNDRQIMSPPFELSFGPNVMFTMTIYPRGGSCFRNAGGKGYIRLKCEDELPEAMAHDSFCFSIGNETTL